MSAYPIDPPLQCDLVLKGGITSGVIYPRAVCELAKVYRLRSVGGSSAGAIAAAAAAAAELGRGSGGFDKLERLPDDITAESPAGGSVLFRLFQPQRDTAGLYRVFTSGLGRSGPGKGLVMLPALVRAFAVWATVGALPGAAVLVLGSLGDGTAAVAAIAAGAALVALGAFAGTALGAIRGLGAHVPRNDFGLCTGMPGNTVAGGRGARQRGRPASALTPWLHETLQRLAGRESDDPPLTFGNLMSAGVELRMMVTNLSRRQPLAMPWSTREYFFSPAEFRELFPEPVVTWMEQHAAEVDRQPPMGYLPLPLSQDLPIIVATRMSLSFPLLLSAVPLHAFDFSDVVGGQTEPTFDVQWFSDGGICSNLPVHFFDSPLPSRPTFAVDLASFPASRTKSADERDNSYLPTVNLTGGLQRHLTRWKGSGIGAISGFLMSIIDTSRAWVDESHLTMPGYRDRIVTIFHDDQEGGINLNMEPRVVTELAQRGAFAAAKLVSWFAGDSPSVVTGPGWDRHRWIRFRTATNAADQWLRGFRGGWTKLSPGATSYDGLVGVDAKAPLGAYELTRGRREAVDIRTHHLLDVSGEWSARPADAFSHNAPRPWPRLELTPDDDSAG
jgi:predicted acylesterase/phospholipase RssA